ncbi:MAG: hypothetical protein ABR903_10230, partial [Thermodesulfovibrionales bacterium]
VKILNHTAKFIYLCSRFFGLSIGLMRPEEAAMKKKRNVIAQQSGYDHEAAPRACSSVQGSSEKFPAVFEQPTELCICAILWYKVIMKQKREGDQEVGYFSS